MRIVDIHCHIIPGVDDGAKNKQEAIEMLMLQKEQGVVGIIATPHFRRGMFTSDINEVNKSYRWLRVKAQELGIQLFLGRECYVDEQLPEFLNTHAGYTIGKSNYVLVEFSSAHNYYAIRKYMVELMGDGYQPIMAHIDRVPKLENDLEAVEELLAMGIEIQVNAESILGKSGRKTKKWMMQLMKRDMIHYIASDSHNTLERVPNLGKCYKYVKRRLGREYARRIFYNNPMKILREYEGIS